MQHPTKFLLIVVLANALAACAATRTHESTGEVVDDVTITTKVKAALVGDAATKERDITVQTYRGVVALSGFVASNDERREAASVSRGVLGVRDVRNELTVQSESRTVGTAIDDGAIATKVKAALIGNPVTKARDIDVTVNHGVVELSGFVDSTEEMSTATDVARSVQGVKDVNNALHIKPAP
jgi:hyperosmotically inducible protein